MEVKMVSYEDVPMETLFHKDVFHKLLIIYPNSITPFLKLVQDFYNYVN